jgi:hypothetical protein
MSKSSTTSASQKHDQGQAFVNAATAAMRRAARAVAAENKRLGLPLIAEPIKSSSVSKR